MYIITDWNPFEKVPRVESKKFSKKQALLWLLESVDFHKKGLRFASQMCSIGKHPRPPACGSLRGKSKGFRSLIDAVLRASLIQAQNMIDEMSDACYNMDNQSTLRGAYEK